MKTLWIDMLCFSSAAKAVGLSRKQPIDQIYYINIHKLFKPFVGLLARFIGKPVVQINDNNIVEAEQKIGERTLYEIIQDRLTEHLTAWVTSKAVNSRINPFLERTGLDHIKYREHLKETAYFLVFRPVEIQVIAQSLGSNRENLFLLKAGPLNGLVKGIYGVDQVSFYSVVALSASLIEKRPGYYYDKYVHNKYYGGTFTSALRLLAVWLTSCLNGFILSRREAQPKQENIGVELIQGRVRLDDINDVYWLKNSKIDTQKVCGLAFVDYDERSLQELKTTGIRLYRTVDKLLKNPFRRLKQNTGSYNLVSAGRGYFARTFMEVLRFLPFLFLNNSRGWFKLQAVRFYVRSIFWRDIYEKLGLTMLWTMFDVDTEKLIKAQALELINGFYLGSHWSNFPMYKVDNQKCYDLLFTWGDHFITNNFSKYPHQAIIKAGYPSDHYFGARKQLADKLKRSFEKQFVISFQDNMIANDIPYSKDMQLNIHRMLIDLLQNNDKLALLLKPKRKHVFEQIIAELPELQCLMTVGRVKVFLGETTRSKAIPAEIGLASDLVIGLGISTTAAECCFAGTVSFHADLTGFKNNEFGKAGLNKVVFRDIDSLKTAVEAQISGKGMSVDECRKYHKMLDPFQDGLAYKRTGFVIKKLQEAFQAGLSREETVKSVQKAYEDSLAKKEDILA